MQIDKFISTALVLVFLFSCRERVKDIAWIERVDPEIAGVLDNDATISILSSGYAWSEGPVWLQDRKILLFSDIPANSIYQWSDSLGVQLYLRPSGYTGPGTRGGELGSNALLLNKQGQLVLCQHGDRRISVMEAPLDHPAPKFRPLATHYRGKRFNSPNDAVYRSNADLFFTDPPYGLEKGMLDPGKEIPFQGVYRLDTRG